MAPKPEDGAAPRPAPEDSLKHRARRFFSHDLWVQDFSALPWPTRALFALLRVLGIAGRGFVADRCALQASALTYVTLMSLVPILALMFSMSKGLGAQNRLMAVAGLQKNVAYEETTDAAGKPTRTELVSFTVVPDSKLSTLPAQLQEFATRIFGYVDNTDFSALGTIGSLLLFWTVVSVMGQIENAFNGIWGVRDERSLDRRFRDYVSILVVVPFLVLVASSVTALLSSTHVTSLLQEKLGPLYPLYQVLLNGLGLIILFVAFTLLYVFMPNTKVRFVPAAVAGVSAGSLWYACQVFYIQGQIGVTKYNAIYGTFAAIPIFLLFLYLSWIVVLLGAEIGFAVQHQTAFLKEREVAYTTFATREMLGFLITQDVCRSFAVGTALWTAAEYARKHGLPFRLVDGVVAKLAEEGVLLPTASGRVTGYVPARDPERLTLAEVERAFRGEQEPRVKRIADLREVAVRDAFSASLTPFSQALGTRSFRDLVKAQSAATPELT